ncbi:M23 family metallopeptidase [Algoriphagus mannitolivorans]|uniref:M23 family metallopeptidase n=1 Tax=Algoriphagus mannitolivorans TaxID=226504 RepID=UPI0004094103|nr:M23 family metallopeptidase [Algoriphagus mannitolivorans]
MNARSQSKTTQNLAFRRLVWLVVMTTLSFQCKPLDPPCESGKNLFCEDYEWTESAYILPYPKGLSFRVNQGNNNTCGGHQGAYQYGYDFDMPIGSTVIASRSGIVSEVRNDNPDGVNLSFGNENLVKILHEDGTTMGYSHLKQHSIVVKPGQLVLQGDTLGLSGNSGYTNNFPHLHFHLSTCDEPVLPGCSTILVKFKNTRPNPCGLVQNEVYLAS